MISKRIIRIIVIFIAFCAIGLMVSNYLSYKKVDIVYGDNVNGLEVEIINSNGEVVKTVDGAGSVRLKKGLYVFTTEESEDFAKTDIEFLVEDSNNDIFINPDYSKNRLAQMLSSIESKIQATISSNVTLGTSFKLNPGELYVHGGWYGTTIVPNLSEEELRTSYVDMFRIALKENNGNWEILTPPKLVLNKYDLPDVPDSVLAGINSQQSGEDEASNNQ